MNKIQFNELIAYINNRPSEAERLRVALLGKSELQAAPIVTEPEKVDQWLKASEVGEMLGVSSAWVRERLQYLPNEMYRKAHTGRGKKAWLINITTAGAQLQAMR